MQFFVFYLSLTLGHNAVSPIVLDKNSVVYEFCLT